MLYPTELQPQYRYFILFIRIATEKRADAGVRPYKEGRVGVKYGHEERV